MSGLSPTFRRLAGAHERAVRAPREGLSDEAFAGLVDETGRLEDLIAREPVRAAGDVLAKLELLCRRLRERVEAEVPDTLTDYMLAETARDGLVRFSAEWPALEPRASGTLPEPRVQGL